MKHTELIERLRAGSGGMKHWQELESEAADAIESLQAEVERVTESCNKAAKPSEPNYEMLRLLENANEDLIAIEKRQHSNPEILAADIRSKLNKAIDLCVIDIARAGFRWALTKQPTQPDRDELDALKAERDALKLDAERYRWLVDNRSYSYWMQPDSPAEHGIEYQWQQGTYEERNHGLNETIDAAIAAMKDAA